ncbi:hypothetical protein [Drosophila-associated adintovirus 2]|uniref:Uncharacterized protein n=1 Tax=Drosophila-associated adintovirus 2 TaxID=2744817 RepID=A0A7D4ZGK5_9VIRU|nr:hypothetical protein [Drosophila-associated adintovirus 2]
MVIKQIELFVIQLKGLIFEDHLERIKYIKSILTELENQQMVTSKFGKHYITCVWSNDNAEDGPDTCRCCFITSYKIEALRLILTYFRHKENRESDKNIILYLDKNITFDLDYKTLSLKTLTIQIEVFLSHFGDSIFDEHLERLNQLKTILFELSQQQLMTSRFGSHFSSCAWSCDDATAGSESCRCIRLSSFKTEAIQLMTRYYNLKEKLYFNKKPLTNI